MRSLKPSETQIQASVVQHWRLLGRPNTLVACLPNAGAMGQPGLTKGLPDLLVLAPSLPVAFIELKRDENSVITDEQLDFAKLCAKLGIPCVICVGRDDPIRLLAEWGVVRRAAA